MGENYKKAPPLKLNLVHAIVIHTTQAISFLYISLKNNIELRLKHRLDRDIHVTYKSIIIRTGINYII
jgi:hypothetical protein